MRTIYLIPVALLLTGCGAGSRIGSISGGECHLVHTPQFAVAGKAQPDQNWIDDTTESLVRGCGQSRPQARPAAFDKKPVKVITPAAKKKWPSFLKRKPVSKPPVANEPPAPKDLPPMRKADPLWPPVTEPPEPPKQIDPPVTPQPVPPPTSKDWWYYLRR